MLIRLDFSLSAWVRNLELEATSEEDAINKLKGMTFAELFDEGVNIDSDFMVQDITTEVVERDLTARVTNIEYDFSIDRLDTAVIEYLKARLPKELTVKLTGVRDSDDLEELIKDEIYAATDYDAGSFDFEII